MKRIGSVLTIITMIFLGLLSAGCDLQPSEYTLTVTTSGSGTVTPSGTVTYAPQTTVTLTATPASGWEFVSWTGDVSGSSTSIQVVMNSNKTVVANFSESQLNEIEYQAENATLYNAAVENEHTGYTGSGYVNFDNETGSSMTWTINAAASGNVDLTFRYANGTTASRTMNIIVNGSTAVSGMTFGATGAWTSWAETTVTVYLAGGSNQIQAVSVSAEGGPNIDRIVAVGNLEENPNTSSSDDLIGFATVSANGLSTTTGGAGGTTVTVSTASAFLNYIQASGSYIVQVSGTIYISGMNTVASNKTIIGLGSNAAISGGGLNLSGVSNIIIRNIYFTNAGDDSINIQESSHHIWIDHCDFSNAYDGLVDIKRESSYITVSWNHFYNHDHACLLGHDDAYTADIGKLKVSYHHNWFDGTASRHPRVRFGHVHVFNNYYLNNDYGVASTMEADVLVEGNYFQNVEEPCLVGYADSADGDLVERNNIYNNCGTSPETRGSVDSFPYSYSLDSALSIPSIVQSSAGVGKI